MVAVVCIHSGHQNLSYVGRKGKREHGEWSLSLKPQIYPKQCTSVFKDPHSKSRYNTTYWGSSVQTQAYGDT